jgi:hypothetical protein
MSDSRASAGLDRLPWLTDEPQPRPGSAKRDLTGWAIVAVVLVAGASFWLGTRSEKGVVQQPPSASPVASSSLPAPRATSAPQVRIAPPPQVTPAPMREVRPVRLPEVHIAPPPHRSTRRAEVSHAVATPKSSVESHPAPAKEAASPATTAAPPPARATPLRPWPPRVVQGAYGRLAQVGAYGSVHQAKVGWWSMVRAYPAMAHLPAVVVQTRNSHGRAFYRFQVGTTSQAHSEVLCQRMQRIGLSCAIIGLPWKAKIER